MPVSRPSLRRPAVSSAPACPLCEGASSIAFAATDRNRAITNEQFSYHRCGLCEALFLAPVPADLARFYPSSYYGLPQADELDELARGERHKIDLLLRHTEAGRLVEIGAGFGVFSRAARNAGFDVTAIEMDQRSVGYLETVVGVRAINSARPEEALRALPPSRVLAMWHSIEHLPQPWQVLERAAANLEPGGLLVVATPNPQALQFRLLGSRWAHLDAPRHLFLLPASALAARARELGLRCVSITTSDPAGRHWNRFGWEYALRRHPAVRPSTRATRMLSLLLTQALRAIEARGLNGTAYTAVFVKSAERDVAAGIGHG
jgi:SAM-dependent methyltransferase